MLEFIEAVVNPENNAKRVSFRISGETDKFIVVKLFDTEDGQDEIWTFKVWHGDYDKVKNHWNTKTAFDMVPEEWELTRNILSEGFSFLKLLEMGENN